MKPEDTINFIIIHNINFLELFITKQFFFSFLPNNVWRSQLEFNFNKFVDKYNQHHTKDIFSYFIIVIKYTMENSLKITVLK
jgi:hypothetical protein